MRIALVYDTLYPESKGGVERRVWEIARRFEAKGHEVHLLVPKYWSGSHEMEREGVLLRGVSRPRPVHVANGRRALIPSLSHGAGVLRLLRKERFDIVDCQTPAFPAALAAFMGTRGAGQSLVITWHEAWGPDWIEEMGVLGPAGWLVEGLVMRLPNAHHITVSPHTAGALSRLAGLEVEVVPPGVDFHAIDGIGRSSSLRSDILYAGRLIPKKNVDLLIGAAAQLVERGLDPVVLVAGEGPDHPRLVEQIRRLGLDKFIRLIGRVDSWRELIEIMKATRVLALPSLREGFGMVVLEAAACGVPTVTVEHRRNAAADLVQDGVTGLIAQPTERAYADALEAVLIDESKRRAMGERARASAIHYGWDTTARATEDFYTRAVNA